MVPVLVPVARFTPKFEASLSEMVAPEMVAPREPVSSPAEVIVPVLVVEMFPVVVTLSPAVVGESVVPERDQ
jgi:hypothetical protein